MRERGESSQVLPEIEKCNNTVFWKILYFYQGNAIELEYQG